MIDVLIFEQRFSYFFNRLKLLRFLINLINRDFKEINFFANFHNLFCKKLIFLPFETFKKKCS